MRVLVGIGVVFWIFTIAVIPNVYYRRWSIGGIQLGQDVTEAEQIAAERASNGLIVLVIFIIVVTLVHNYKPELFGPATFKRRRSDEYSDEEAA